MQFQTGVYAWAYVCHVIFILYLLSIWLILYVHKWFIYIHRLISKNVEKLTSTEIIKMYERKTRKGQTTHQKLSAWTIRPDTGKGKPIKLPSASNLIHLIISINQGMGINSNGMVYTCVMQSSMYKQYRKLTWYRFYKVLFVHLFNQYFTHIKMYTDKVTFFVFSPLFFFICF